MLKMSSVELACRAECSVSGSIVIRSFFPFPSRTVISPR